MNVGHCGAYLVDECCTQRCAAKINDPLRTAYLVRNLSDHRAMLKQRSPRGGLTPLLRHLVHRAFKLPQAPGYHGTPQQLVHAVFDAPRLRPCGGPPSAAASKVRISARLSSVAGRRGGDHRSGAAVSLMMVVWDTPEVRAMSVNVSPASRRSIASRCWWRESFGGRLSGPPLRPGQAWPLGLIPPMWPRVNVSDGAALAALHLRGESVTGTTTPGRSFAI